MIVQSVRHEYRNGHGLQHIARRTPEINLLSPSDLPGAYNAVGAGVAIAAEVSGVRLQNANRVLAMLLARS